MYSACMVLRTESPFSNRRLQANGMSEGAASMVSAVSARDIGNTGEHGGIMWHVPPSLFGVAGNS